MNEEKYTRDAKKSAQNHGTDRKKNESTKSYGGKLKNETSANKSYREKLRYGKKDNSLTVSESKKLRKMKNRAGAKFTGKQRQYRLYRKMSSGMRMTTAELTA